MIEVTLKRRIPIVGIALLAAVLPSAAGTISLTWDPASGATGYTVFYGTKSGDYTGSVDVGNVTETVVNGLTDCTTWFLAVKAYNGGPQEASRKHSADYSNEVSGWPRPALTVPAPSAVLQGDQLTMRIPGANFQAGASIAIDAPTDRRVYFETPRVVDCHNIEIALTAAPARDVLQPALVGTFNLAVTVTNPDQVYQTQTTPFEVRMDPARFNMEVSEENTRLRLDEADLATFSKAWKALWTDSRYDPDADFDGNGIVDGTDLADAYASGLFGKCWNGTTYTFQACPASVQ